MRISRLCRTAPLWVVLLGFAAVDVRARAPTEIEVIANVSMTPAGRKVPHPTSEQPAYYVPVIFGYHQVGQLTARDTPPSRKELVRLVGQALARQGYVLQAARANAAKTLPSLVLTFEWGSLQPATTDFGEDATQFGLGSDQTAPHVVASFNADQLRTLVLGDGAVGDGDTMFSVPTLEQRLREAVEESRYYLIVSAYDFAASMKGQQVLLWRARMSVDQRGVMMDDVVSALVSAGAELFGRSLVTPQLSMRKVREGKVQVGAPETKELDVPLPNPSRETKPTSLPR